MTSDERELVRELASYPTFAGCSDADLKALVGKGTVAPLPDGWAFTREGETADAVYVLLSGRVDVYQDRHVVNSLGTGELIGEMALVEAGQRLATVATVGRCRTLRIGFDDFRALAASRPAVAAVLQRTYQAHRAAGEAAAE